MRALLPLILLALGALSCERQEPLSAETPKAVGKDGWLRGTTDQKLDTVAKHLRGNDLVMWEVGHRHHELHVAIQSGNPQYAGYQFEKILLAMEMGVERRPARKMSYDAFFEAVKAPMSAALAQGDQKTMLAAYQTLTAHCVACHAKEQVSWIPVARPWEQPPQP